MANGYRPTQTLREDAESTLVRARSVDTGRPVLLLSARRRSLALERLEREYAIRGDLDPRWSVRPLSLLRRENDVTLVLEDPGGMALNGSIFRPGSVAEVLRVAIGLSSSLNQVHQSGLIHQDIKPANVLFNPTTAEARLMGFGIASRLPRERQPPVPPETIAGTLAYMAPEQTGRTNRSIDSRSDLYSLGVTLYEVLTGALPFTASEPMDWIHCHVARLPTPPAELNPGIPVQLSAVIMKLLAKAPEERYQTAAGLEADLRRCLADWQGSGRIEPFALAEHDTSTRLRIPEKLYGRKRESETLLAAWERVVSNAKPELVLVSGYSGVGKSSLVNEFRRSIAPRGLFATGKVDERQRGVPYATVARAFSGLIQQLLVEPEETVARYRSSIQEAVGKNGQLVVDLVPELELVIGKQEAVPELAPQEAQNRYRAVLTRFVGVFAHREHPLALFLDDLQWFDPASLEVLEHFLSSSELGSLLLIGAYRDNEVSPSHPSILTLDRIRRSALPIHEIVLAPLSAEGVTELVAETVHCAREEAAPLAQLVHEKTAGNPFFTKQFLTALHDDGLLALEGERWTWDLARIRAVGFTDNVAELMIGKLRRLSVATQNALKGLACLGHRAEATTLTRVLGQDAERVQVALREAVVAGLVVVAGDDGYAFAHDRIREAAYCLIPEQERASEHLRIGRVLLSGRPEQEVEEEVFELVNHFNRGLELVTDASEKGLIRRLNFRAGTRAKASIAYASARTYLAQATALQPPEAWNRQYDETFALTFALSECEYLVGHFARADELFDVILDRARSDLDRAKVYRRRAALYQMAGRFQDAVRAGLEGLALFGIVAPESPEALEADFSHELEEFRVNLRGRRIAELVDATEASDAEARAVIGLCAEIYAPLYTTRSPSFRWFVLKGVNTSLRFGHTEDSCIAYSSLAALNTGPFDDFQTGFELSELALRLNERFHDAKLRGRLLFCLSVLNHSWRKPFATSLPIAEQAVVASLNVGDFVHASYSALALVWQSVMAGKTIDEAIETSRRALDVARTSRIETMYEVIRHEQQLLACLKGLTSGPTSFEDDSFDEAKSVALLEGSGFRTGITYRLVLKQLAAVIYGCDDEALAYSRQSEATLPETGTPLTITQRLCHALALTSAYSEAPPAERAEFAATLEAIRKKLRVWAENCPENFVCMEQLVWAEVARIEGRELDAMRAYELAIASACENGLVYVESMACERAAKFYLERGFDRSAYAYFRDARAAYLRWGALGKVKQLDQLYPAIEKQVLAPTATIGTAAEQLDVPHVIKASLAVSGEIVPERLIEKLLGIVLAQAGAERGLLLLPRAGEFTVEAVATTGGGGVDVVLTQRLPSPDDLPESVLRYVVRTHNRVVLDDASEGMFSTDQYVKQRRSRSILCLPLIKQTTLVGVLYLENNLTSGAFTSDRVAMLEVLASQAAISLENARLYDELVDERSRLRVSEERFATAFHNSPTPMAISRLDDDVFLDANERFVATFGFERSEFIGHSAVELGIFDTEEIDEVRAVVNEVGLLRDHEVQARKKTGEQRTLLVSLAPIEVGGERCLLTTFIDLTERKQVEAQLRQSQKMEAIGSLAGGIAHDFNNLLTVINGSSELATLGMAASDPNYELCHSILDAGERAAGLTRKLLSFCRKEVGETKEWNLNTVVLDMEAMLRRLIEKDVELVTRLAPAGVMIQADRSQVEQVILNLVLNARDAMPDGGRVTIRTGGIPLEQDSATGDHVMLTVEDTGTGMTREVRAHLFEPFFTTKEAGKGTGLGLSVVHRILEQSGGHISVSSEPGVGSTFRVYFPRAKVAVERSASEKPTVLSGNERVLVAEDEGSIGKFVTQALEFHGYRVYAVENGREALKLLKDSAHPIDIVVSDVVMPNMGGRELAKRIQAEQLAVPVLFMSGYAKDLDIHSWLEAGRVDFLPKPFHATDLAKKVRELLDESRVKTRQVEANQRDGGRVPASRPVSSQTSQRE